VRVKTPIAAPGVTVSASLWGALSVPAWVVPATDRA
jgi:hypothetical protein